MADEINPQAQAATEQSPTAAENTALSAVTAVDSQTNLNPVDEVQPDVEGLDAATYKELAEQFRDGRQPAAKAQEQPAAEEIQQPVQTDEAPKKPEDDNDLPDRIRLTQFSDVEKLALKLVRDSKDTDKPVSLAEAEQRAKAFYGIEAAKPAEQPPADTTPTTAEGLEAHIISLKERIKAAAKDVDTEAMFALQEEVDAAKDRLTKAREKAAEEGQQISSALQEVRAELRKEYPAFSDPKSPLSTKWAEISAQLEARNHPILSDPVEATRYITFLAAKAVGANSVQSAVAPSKPSAPAKLTPPIQPASGALRTVAPASQTGQIESQIDSVNTLADYERLKKEMLAA